MSTKNIISAKKTQEILDACDLAARIVREGGTAAVLGEPTLADAVPDLAHTAITLHAEVARLTAELQAARAIIEGRTVAPTEAEIAIHPGEWLVDGEVVGLYFADDRDTELCARLTSENLTYRGSSARLWLRHAAEESRRWIALDAEGRPCAWPVVSR